MDDGYDLLVIGAGMAGMTAAAKAAEDGKTVCVVEIGEDTGGSARFAGYIWTAPDHETMAEHNPDGDERLRRALVDGFAPAVDWIRSIGTDIGQAQPILSFGRGHRIDTHQYLDLCGSLVRRAGGVIGLRTAVHDVTVENGAVTGATVARSGTPPRHIRARRTVLATGGFQGDTELIAHHVHPGAGQMPLRSNPHSSGAGYRLATAIGASTGADDAGFYGHLVPAGVSFADPADFVALSLYYSEHALLFNLDNRRFVDETLGDHLTSMALLNEREGRGLLVADARVRRDWMLTSYVRGAAAVDKFDLASRRGGRVGVADTLDDLEYLPQKWGYDGSAIAAAVVATNEQRDGHPSRALDPSPLSEPPYYVIEASPAITFPFHGIRIDDRARVLDARGVPVPGLRAAGSDTGGLWNRAYGGGLATAAVFGLAAAGD